MTTRTTIEVFQKAVERGLKLGFEPPNTLTLQPARLCSVEFAEVLKAHKPAVLALLQLPFVMVYSNTLEETVFFCDDDVTKAALSEAGASEWSIYTKEELRVLLTQNRIAPLSHDELRKVHEIKRTFHARIRP